MKITEIEKAKRKAMVFVDRCNKLILRAETGNVSIGYRDGIQGCRESGDVRRASMELTRQLSKMRK